MLNFELKFRYQTLIPNLAIECRYQISISNIVIGLRYQMSMWKHIAFGLSGLGQVHLRVGHSALKILHSSTNLHMEHTKKKRLSSCACQISKDDVKFQYEHCMKFPYEISISNFTSNFDIKYRYRISTSTFDTKCRYESGSPSAWAVCPKYTCESAMRLWRYCIVVPICVQHANKDPGNIWSYSFESTSSFEAPICKLKQRFQWRASIVEIQFRDPFSRSDFDVRFRYQISTSDINFRFRDQTFISDFDIRFPDQIRYQFQISRSCLEIRDSEIRFGDQISTSDSETRFRDSS